MKNVIRAAVVCVSAASLLGCNVINAARRGDGIGAVQAGVNQAADAKRINDEAEAKSRAVCGGAKDSTPGWDEERAIGGAIAIGLAQKSKGFLIDIKQPGDLAALQAEADKGTLKLDDTDKNRLNAYLARVGGVLTAQSGRPTIPWAFGVIDSTVPNAFSAPGGYVFVTTGLLALVENEAQLAGILGHEIAHVTEKHALKTYAKIKYDQCNVATQGGVFVARGAQKLAPAPVMRLARLAQDFSRLSGNGSLDVNAISAQAISSLTDGVVEDISTLGNAKEDEFSADAVAQNLIISAGYDASEYEKFLAKIPSGGGWLDHHPTSADRVAKLAAARANNGWPATAKPSNPPEFSVLKK